MAGIPAPGSRRRSGPPAPSSGPPPSTQHPPSKRARGFLAAAPPDTEDPFGAHGDFTADDLEELDTLASQALSQCPNAAPDVSNVHKVPRLDGMSKNPARRNRESVPVKDNFELELLQAQYKELKEKMKAMEEEVLIKNGEIKILRDSLHQTESILEEQRRSHFLLEQEKTQALSDKEKEFSKKLQSLQSELQFKDAEMNELRTKLQSSERANKLAAPSISHVRFQCVFRVLPQCLRPETPLPSVLLTIELLSLLVDHEKLAPQLCSHPEGCLLLLLYMYITSRPDKAASETQWLQLEQEAVWLLAKLAVQSPSSPVTGSSCQCNVEVVRALTVMLHRQWLTVRRAGGPPRTDQQKRTVRCLRDTVLLLHSLSQKDKLFTVHCVEVLHQYDQVMPGVSMLIRGLPDVTGCEEAALDDLCAVEADVDDPEMDCG
ncbi:ATR-interacting protein isoform X3 [Kogia breviceps]|uniref:ATR-interacting protein isoform X3 n=1 Tax=Kogia breviceps TaxID=27615 RepID=UPI0034D2BDF9